MTPNLAWLLLFIIAWAVALLVVPWDRLAGLLLPGFLGGTLLALIVNLIGVPILGLWHFPAAISMLGIPVFLLLAYTAEMILFLHYWDHLPGGSAEKGIYIIAFSLMNTGLAYLALLMGYVVFYNWTLVYFLISSLAVHVLSLLFYSTIGIREVRSGRRRSSHDFQLPDHALIFVNPPILRHQENGGIFLIILRTFNLLIWERREKD